MFRRIARYQLVVDLVIAGGFFLALAPIALSLAARGTPLWHFGVLLAMSAALALRRLSPGLALAVAGAGAIFQMATGQTPVPSNVAIFAVLYTTAAYGGRVVRWLGLASAGAGAIVSTAYLLVTPIFSLNLVRGDNLNTVARLAVTFGILLVFAAGSLGLAWTCGLAVRTTREARARRAAQERAEAEQRRARHAEALEAERGRIARDMHDVVAHSLAVVIAQADGARYARAADPAAVEASLGTISQTAREALGEVRVLLEQLRYSQSDGPQPVLADVPALVDRMRAAGLDIRQKTTGDAGTPGAAVQLACYRILQEALTNALRHGDRDRPVSLETDWAASSVTIRVTNAVRPEDRDGIAPEPGHGLAGMRERALLAGGTLGIRAEDGRFVVTAAFPRVPSAAPAEPARTAGTAS